MTGLPWAKYVVAAAALMGILTGPLIGFYAGARIIYVLGRERLLPPVFAQMSPRFGTPVVATAMQGIIVCELLPQFTYVFPLLPSSPSAANTCFWLLLRSHMVRQNITP